MSDWLPPSELPDLRRVGVIGLDTETKDEGLHVDHGPGWPWGGGYVCGISLAWRADSDIRATYIPLRHPDSANFDRDQVTRWLRDLIASDVHIITKNGLYDWGWLRTDLGIAMPPAERLEELDALATLVDENRRKYSLDALCAWRGFSGKEEALLHEGCAALGLIPKKSRKKFNPKAFIWQLPAHLVGPYAETDAVRTLQLFENLNPVLDREGTRDAYRLEIDLLPMVHAMRRRGIRIDSAAAEHARDLILRKRDAVLAQISEKLGANVGMDEINGRNWKIKTFDQLSIAYPRTEKNNPSFRGGKKGWMLQSSHWLPQLIATALQLNQYGNNFLQTQILDHLVNGRVYGEIHPHRSDSGGTRSFRFSYSHPPLQQMPKHDEELAPLIRGVFLPEDGEAWASCDFSQQEFRLVVHFAIRHKLMGATAARDRYINDPSTDIHAYVSELTGGMLNRQDGKTANFMKIYGAGVEAFALQIKKPLDEAKRLYALYDEKIPFVSQLADKCKYAAQNTGLFRLFNGARRHFNLWAPGGTLPEGAGPCERAEAERRMRDPGHPWYGQRLWRAETYKALNTLIQSAAAIQTKLWMRACWREGVVPLLQMHDSLDLSVTSPEMAEMVARLGEEIIALEVPMKVDVKYGRTWGDAKHTWTELHTETGAHIELSRERTPREAPKLFNDFHSAPESVPADDIAITVLNELSNERSTDDEADELPWEEPHASEPAPEPSHICIHCHRDPPDGLERVSAYDGAYLHPDCQVPFIRLRMAEEGIEWQSATFAQTEPPSPAVPSVPPAPPPKPATGNGLDNLNDFINNYPAGERDDVGVVMAKYIYFDLKSAPYLKVIKRRTSTGKKYFPQYHLENGRWVKGKPAGPAILYRLLELLAAPPNATIEICEGEKDADTLAKLGLIATTNPGGAGKWTPELNKWLSGFARANIYEDNDAPGRKHAVQVAAALSGIIPDIRVITFREMPEHSDVSDWLKTGKTREQLLERAEQTTKFLALEAVCADDEEIKNLTWIWPGRFALGKIGLIVGLPDEGKGLTLSDIMARITRGSLWPCNEGTAPLGNVLLLTAEDDINDTIIPRLLAAGADLKRVHIIKMIRDSNGPRMFSLISDLPALRQKVLEIGDVRMIVIDPISSYLGIGKIDSFRATDVRAVLGPLKEFAAELGLTVLGIMHFNKKTDVTNVLLRISDSLAYGAAARHVYGVVNDPDNFRKLFVKGKNNLAPLEQKTLAFSFSEREVGTDKQTGAPIRAPYIVWFSEPVDITAAEAMQAAAENKSPSARDNAKQFLEALLSSAPVASKEVHEAAKENGVSPRTLRRAKDELGVEVRRDGPIENGVHTWRWHLPEEPQKSPSTPQMARERDLAT